MATEPLFPTVHLNGSSRNVLIDQLHTAHQRLYEAIAALRHAGPHGRDYYVQGRHTISQLLAEHADRLQRLERVQDELGTILTHVIDQHDR
jgi:hypothetical protein